MHPQWKAFRRAYRLLASRLGVAVRNMKTKILMAGAVGMLLLGGMASVTAYHIDAPWVPIDPTTTENTTCPANNAGGAGGAAPDEAGTDCPNNAARGWTFNPNGLFTVCEQNRVNGVGSQPGVNGMCFASNVKYSYSGEPGVVGDSGHSGPQGEGGGTPASRGGNPGTTVVLGAPAMTDWTRFIIFSNAHPYLALACDSVLGVSFFDQTDPHDDAVVRGPALGTGPGSEAIIEAVSPYLVDPAVSGPLIPPNGGGAAARTRCVPRNVGVFDDGATAPATCTVAFRAQYHVSTTAPSPCTTEQGLAGGNVVGQVRACSNAHGVLLNGGETPVGTLGAMGTVGSTFLYRELIPFYGCGGHITFFVQAVTAGWASTSTTPATTGGSYWAEDNRWDTSATGGTIVGGMRAPLSTALCNQLYDVSETNVISAVDSYFDIFEPVTYTTGVPGLWNTACRAL